MRQSVRSLADCILAPAAAGCASLLVFGTAAPAAAQDEISPPRILERVEPEPQTGMFGIPLEGWVSVRYSVLANGTAADVRVVDVMPPRLKTKGVVSALERWKFAPATAGGQPVDWHNNESVVVFDAPDVPLEPSPFFLQAYSRVAELLKEEEYDRARKQNAALLENQVTRLVEVGIVQVQAAALEIAAGNLHDAYDAILRATNPEAVTLQGSDLANALRYRFGIELELGRYASALETFDRLQTAGLSPGDDVLKTQADAVREALKGVAAVTIKGRVDRAPWSYPLTRRTFGFAEFDGTVRALELECDRRKAQLEFSLDAEWSIPESWGECLLFVDGRRDMTFSVIEFPTPAAAP